VTPRAEADPGEERRVDAFFYGLFVDERVLRESGAMPVHPRKAFVDGFALRIGRRATLLPSPGARVYGMIFALTHAELERLYSAPGLERYRPEAVLARTLRGPATPALCFNLPDAPGPEEANPDYAARLRRILGELGLPSDHVESAS
jgi:hypothetical protein